jgi:tryptophan synthase beta chain
VRQVYRHWRPTPLFRAAVWNADTGPIYYKYEGVSPAGSHHQHGGQQAYYNKQGIRGWSPRRSRAMGIVAVWPAPFWAGGKVYMVRISYDRSPIAGPDETYGAVTPSPSPETSAGRTILAQNRTRRR